MRRADHSSRGDLPSVMCLNACDRETSMKSPDPLGAVVPLEKIYINFNTIFHSAFRSSEYFSTFRPSEYFSV